MQKISVHACSRWQWSNLKTGVTLRKYGEQKSETIALDAFVDMIKV